MRVVVCTVVHHPADARIYYRQIQALLDAGKELSERQWETYNLYKPSVATFKQNLKKYADMGLEIVSGTDMISEFEKPAPVAAELALMVDYGMSNLAAIAAGTSNCARVLGLENKTGILAKDAAADILVVEGNPAENIADLERVKAVYFGGERV